MIFVVDAHGGITKIGASSIYQGSVGASQIILLAPLPASLSVTVGFLLPNGTSTSINLASPANMAEINLQGIMTDTEAKNYNAWVYTMQAEVTEYAGTVIVQFFCYGANSSEMLATFASEFVVHKGVAITLPATPTQTIYDQILTALAQANNRLNTLEGSEILRFVDVLPTAGINPQAIYFVKAGASYTAYVRNADSTAWERINDAIVPISSTAEASTNAQKLYLLTVSGEEGLYAYIDGALRRVIDMRDYTELTQLISNAQTTANTASANANTAKANASEALSKANTASANATNALNKADTAQADATQANTLASNANTVASNAQSTANTANNNASEALTTANEALSKAQEALNNLTSVLTFVGSTTFANLPTPSASTVNDIYNITDAFTTTSSFVEGAGKSYPAGTNVAIVLYNGAYKYDVLSGFVDLSAYQAKLVSGTNIKTVNGASILGSGNLEVEGTQGADGVGIDAIASGNPVVGSEYTTTPVSVLLSNDVLASLQVYAKNGADGKDGTDGTNGANGVNGTDGVGIESVTAGSPTESGDNTVTPITITKTDGSSNTLYVQAKNGANGTDGTDGTNGADGVGIANITAGTPSDSGGYTITPVTFTKTNGSSNTLSIRAKNGTDGIDGGGGIMTLTSSDADITTLPVGIYRWLTNNNSKTIKYASNSTRSIVGDPLFLLISNVEGVWDVKRFIVFAGAVGISNITWGEYKPSDGTGRIWERSLISIPTIVESQIVTTNTDQTISGNKTFTGAVDLSGATVTGISSGPTKTKITLAELRERLADYTNHMGEIVQIVYTGTDSTCRTIIKQLGLFTINSRTIDKTVGSTSVTQSAIYGINDVIFINSTSAYINRNSWDFDIAGGATNPASGTNYAITDTNFEIYVIGGV